MKQKILFFIPSLCGRGAEKVLVNLVNNMDHQRYDVTVMVLFGDGVNAASLSDKVTYKWIFRRTFRGNIHLLKLLPPAALFKMFVRDRYDVMISYLEGPTTRILSGCTDPNTKKIAWIHTLIDSPQKLMASYRSVAELKKTYAAYDRVVGVSKAITDKLEAIDGFISKPLRVVYNTLETDMIKAGGEEAVDDLTFSPEVVNLCSVGGLVEVKGYDRLLSILNRLVHQDKITNVHLRIFGEGADRAKYEAYVKEHRLESYVSFPGWRGNVYKYVKSSDLFVCSSYREGFSTAVSEALIVGTAVISTHCSGATEILGQNNEYGIVTDNNDEALYQGMRMLIEDQRLLCHYKKQAGRRASFFNTVQSVESVQRLCKEVSAQ